MRFALAAVALGFALLLSAQVAKPQAGTIPYRMFTSLVNAGDKFYLQQGTRGAILAVLSKEERAEVEANPRPSALTLQRAKASPIYEVSEVGMDFIAYTVRGQVIHLPVHEIQSINYLAPPRTGGKPE